MDKGREREIDRERVRETGKLFCVVKCWLKLFLYVSSHSTDKFNWLAGMLAAARVCIQFMTENYSIFSSSWCWCNSVSERKKKSLNFSWLSSFQRFYRFILFIDLTPSPRICADLLASPLSELAVVSHILRFDIMSSLYQKFWNMMTLPILHTKYNLRRLPAHFVQSPADFFLTSAVKRLNTFLPFLFLLFSSLWNWEKEFYAFSRHSDRME